MSADGGEAGAAGSRAPRRRLPLGRGARLVVKGRFHLVGIGDLSVSGAYLITRLPLQVGEEHELRLLLLPSLSEMPLKVRVVRVITQSQAGMHHPQGLAVQFLQLKSETRARLAAFVEARRSELG
jgi:hypothetical protein